MAIVLQEKNVRELELRVNLLFDKIGDCSQSDAVYDLKKLEHEFDGFRRVFHETHGSKPFLWCVLLDIGRIFQRVFNGRRYRAESQLDDYIAVEAVIFPSDDKSKHREAVRTQLLLNRVGRKIGEIHNKLDQVQVKEGVDKFESEHKMFVALYIAMIIMGLLFLSMDVMVFLALTLCLHGGYIILKYCSSLRPGSKRHESHRDDARAINVSCYWAYVWTLVHSNLFTGMFSVLATLYCMAMRFPYMTMLFILLGCGRPDREVFDNSFLNLKSALMGDVVVYAVLLAQSIVCYDFFFGERLDLSWEKLKEKIGLYRVDWYKFLRGMVYASVDYLLVFGPILIAQPWVVIASQWFEIALINMVVIAMQTLSEEIMFRRPAVDAGHSSFGYLCNIFLSAVLFAVAHNENPEFSVLGTDVLSYIALLTGYVSSGLGWAVAAYLSGGLELTWGMHYANNLLLSTLVGYTPSPGYKMPLVVIDDWVHADFSSSVKDSAMWSTYSLVAYIFSHFLSESFYWASVYLAEIPFRPKYYVEPLRTCSVASRDIEVGKITTEVKDSAETRERTQLFPSRQSGSLGWMDALRGLCFGPYACNLI